jgi:hypothetical protein
MVLAASTLGRENESALPQVPGTSTTPSGMHLVCLIKQFESGLSSRKTFESSIYSGEVFLAE